ncbi:MAG: hypothetical protein Q7J59_02575 [Elusimicrobiota bacterium]|nr:hypothetical protein [Elusimicrobiota bacterium]
MLKRLRGFLNFCLIAVLSFYYLQLCGLSVKEFFGLAPQIFILGLSFALLFAGENFMRAFIVPALIYYGMFGLFFYPWTGIDMANQAVHALLLLNALYFLLSLALGFKVITLLFGLAAGLAACAGLRFYQTAFLQSRKDLVKKYLPAELMASEAKKKSVKKNIRSLRAIDEQLKLND